LLKFGHSFSHVCCFVRKLERCIGEFRLFRRDTARAEHVCVHARTVAYGRREVGYDARVGGRGARLLARVDAKSAQWHFAAGPYRVCAGQKKRRTTRSSRLTLCAERASFER
jgi:hypothetical protein